MRRPRSVAVVHFAQSCGAALDRSGCVSVFFWIHTTCITQVGSCVVAACLAGDGWMPVTWRHRWSLVTNCPIHAAGTGGPQDGKGIAGASRVSHRF